PVRPLSSRRGSRNAGVFRFGMLDARARGEGLRREISGPREPLSGARRRAELRNKRRGGGDRVLSEAGGFAHASNESASNDRRVRDVEDFSHLVRPRYPEPAGDGEIGGGAYSADACVKIGGVEGSAFPGHA